MPTDDFLTLNQNSPGPNQEGESIKKELSNPPINRKQVDKST